MKPNQIRDSFLKFFQELDHAVVPSSPVVPQGDNTLLFTNAGMNQFKDVLLGNEVRDYKRAASVQKCVRAGGKHNDLDEVGKDGRHLTFFEMLGNWSFGDYYKRESIQWAWRYIIDVLKLDPSRLYVTIYKDDDECFGYWTNDIGLAPERILRLGDINEGNEENFWSMGPTGPCGPCTEIHYDLHPEYGPMTWAVGYDENRINEIWNLVFMEFNRDETGELNALPMKSVDTGLGLDRAAAILAGVDSVFKTELFTPIFERTLALLGQEMPEDIFEFYARPDFTDFAVIADHVRTVTFAVCDGAQFANEGRGYVLRRILRRAVRYGRNLGFTKPFLCEVASAVVAEYGGIYPELRAVGTEAAELIRLEEERFFRNLERGLELFEAAASRTATEGGEQLSGEEVFQLHATFGFPPDLTEIMAQEQGLGIDWQGYERLWRVHQETSRGKDVHADAAGVGDWMTVHEGGAEHFVGYTHLEATSLVRRFRSIGGAGLYEILLSETPFYAESGGQVGDRGVIRASDGSLALEVLDTQKTPIGIVHKTRLIEGQVNKSTLSGSFEAKVDQRQRDLTASNHTATHLLHAALRDIVADSIFQAGSMVGPDKLRFDFSYAKPVTAEQIEAIESRVNEQIRQRLPVVCHVDIERERAVSEMGAMAIFGEKYGDRVRVVEIPGESVELCGGTHVRNTAEINLFRLTAESGVAAGIRRIEAVTSDTAYELFQSERRRLEEASRILKTDPAHLLERARAMVEERTQLERQLDRLAQKLASSEAVALLEHAVDVGGVQVVATEVKVDTREQFMAYADSLRDRLGAVEGVVLLGALLDDKANLLCVVTDSAVKNRGLKAGQLVNAVAPHVEGKGGGRPNLAQAGGTRVEGLKAAIEGFADAVREAL
ncbi:MAG: alanine--tRNA ligase [Bradymonadaceae bacterium]|nr:alanine--tRNA ligase [Lujinxingiaceae bacterium]